ncbi:tetratricopeptide repeat protein [bacterium]|nr:tetratricopeptide repeat protein [bacterium]
MRNLIPDLKQLGFFDVENDKKTSAVDASVLFVDISGFTNMTRLLMASGSDGAETLSTFMNTIFSPLIESVYNKNGFILNFAGDAFTAVFRDDDGKRAISVALEIRKFFIENPTLSHQGQIFKISAKAGISIGRFNWIAAKGEENLRHFLFFGDVIDEAAGAEHHCSGLDICIDDKVYDRLSDCLVCHMKEDAHFVDSVNFTAPEVVSNNEPTLSELKMFIPDAVLAQQISGEFREIVSLFISYKISKEIPEIEKMLEYLASHVQKYGGYISGFDFGDKGATLLALFGAPISYEDNLERAIDCINEIEKNCDTEIRCGITEGVVYAGFTGSLKRSAYTALGDNVNLSARIMMKARFGGNWIAGKAAEKAKKMYVLESMGNFEFKGIDVPVEVFEIKGRLRREEGSVFSTPFTGRLAELADISSVCEKARSTGRLHCMTVYGEAGIGKSRILYEVKKKFANEFTILTLGCDPILRQSMNLFNSFFHKLFNQADKGTDEENKQNFEKKWQEISSKIVSMREKFEESKIYIAALAGLFWKGSVYDMLDGKARFENTVFALNDFFSAIAEIKPLMLVFDDMLSIDGDSLSVLKTIIGKLDEHKVAVYLLSRLNDDGTKLEFVPDSEDGRFRSKVIEKLSDLEVGALVERILGGKIKSEVAKFVFSRTEGNPFFVEQLVLFMVDKNCFQQVDGVFVLKNDRIEVPSGVNSLLVSRLDRLPSHLKDLVSRASVIGNEIDLSILKEITNDVKNFNELLKDGTEELIWDEISEMMYFFRHSLLRDAAYSMQLKARLKEIHRKIAISVEQNYPNEAKYYATLAFHFGKAENLEKEIVYLRKAADYAKSQYHNEEAEKLYEKLINLLTDDSEIIEVGQLLGGIYKLTGKWDLAEKIFKENLDRAKKINNDLLIAGSMKAFANMLLEKSRYDESSPLLDTAYEIYEKLGNTQGRCEVEGYRGLIHYYKGEMDDALEHFKEKLRLAQQIDDKAGTALSYRYMGGVAYYRGDYSTALDYYKGQLKLAEEMGNAIDIAVAKNNLGLIYSYLNDFNNAADCYSHALETYRKFGIRSYIIYTANNLAELKIWQGLYEEAKELVRAQTEIANDLGNSRQIAIANAMSGNIEKRIGNYDLSYECYDKAIKLGEKLNIASINCEFQYEMADLLYRMGRYDEAADVDEKALKTSREVKRASIIFSCELLKWKIAAQKDPGSAIGNIKAMLENETNKENLADIYFELFMITRDEKYRAEAATLFESLYSVAPKAIYKEKISDMNSNK